MEMNNQLPMIQLRPKETQHYLWKDVLPKFIKFVFQDPKNYSSEIALLDELRENSLKPEFNLIGRDSIYKYFSQLNLFELRIPLKKASKNKIFFDKPFEWSDSFTSELNSSTMLDFEKNCILFNLAVTLSKYANSLLKLILEAEDNSEDLPPKNHSTELATACSNYQIASAIFLDLSENVDDLPFADMHPFSLSVLSKFMLAQAQECVVSKAIFDKKKDSIIAKLCSQASIYYLELSNKLHGITDPVSSPLSDDSFQELVSTLPQSYPIVCCVKMKYYSSLSDLYQAKYCQSKKSFGESVARFNIAKTKIKASISKTQDFEPSIFDNSLQNLEGFGISSHKMLKSSLLKISELINSLSSEAEADNDLIYHEPLPNSSNLEHITPVSVVKPLSLVDTLTEREHIDIVGKDIFEFLIPINIHERASIYSEELSQLLRSEQDKLDLSQSEFDNSLSFMKLSEIIGKFEAYLDNPSSFEEGELKKYSTPHKTLKSLVENSNESSLIIEDLVSQLSRLKSKSDINIDNCSLALNKLSSFQSNSSGNSSEYSEIYSSFKECINKQTSAKESDSSVLQRYQSNVLPYLKVLKKPVTLYDYSFSFLKNHMKNANINISENDNSKTGNLLDIDDGISGSDNEVNSLKKLIGDLKSCNDKANFLKSNHQEVFERFKAHVRDDDISSALMLNPPNGSGTESNDTNLFKEEISKFEPLINQLSDIDFEKKSLVKFLASLIKSINDNNQIKHVYAFQVALDSGCEIIESNLSLACETLESIISPIRSGIKFYGELNSEVNKIFFKVENLVNSSSQSANIQTNQPSSFSTTQSSNNNTDNLSDKNNSQSYEYNPTPISTNIYQPVNNISQTMESMSISGTKNYNKSFSDQIPKNSSSDFNHTSSPIALTNRVPSNVQNSSFDYSRLDERYKKAMQMVDDSIPSINNGSINQPPSNQNYFSGNYSTNTNNQIESSFNSSPSSFSTVAPKQNLQQINNLSQNQSTFSSQRSSGFAGSMPNNSQQPANSQLLQQAPISNASAYPPSQRVIQPQSQPQPQHQHQILNNFSSPPQLSSANSQNTSNNQSQSNFVRHSQSYYTNPQQSNNNLNQDFLGKPLNQITNTFASNDPLLYQPLINGRSKHQLETSAGYPTPNAVPLFPNRNLQTFDQNISPQINTNPVLSQNTYQGNLHPAPNSTQPQQMVQNSQPQQPYNPQNQQPQQSQYYTMSNQNNNISNTYQPQQNQHFSRPIINHQAQQPVSNLQTSSFQNPTNLSPQYTTSNNNPKNESYNFSSQNQSLPALQSAQNFTNSNNYNYPINNNTPFSNSRPSPNQSHSNYNQQANSYPQQQYPLTTQNNYNSYQNQATQPHQYSQNSYAGNNTNSYPNINPAQVYQPIPQQQPMYQQYYNIANNQSSQPPNNDPEFIKNRNKSLLD
ncbi:Vacuolar protein-sorting protein bro1 [Smittium culicis]|uniref:BRO domain-containing protein 1 n=1 Tax=Smittium culicis TaxID=133412 RepID=A0A1R1XUE6_9FUNG|nr:Vacuolar protein-sorting protein bro1 [Smittium culicis]